MKKVLAILLAFTLLLVPFSCAVSAETTGYTDVTLIGTQGWDTCVSGDNWVLYLNTSGYESNDWAYKYKGFTFEYNGKTYTTGQISSAENNRLYCTIPTSIVPAISGETFTIKAGKYDSDADTSTTGLNILNDLTIATVDGRLVDTQVIYADNVETFPNENVPINNAFYFSLKDKDGNGIATGVESWTNFLSPAYCDGTRVLEKDWANTYSGIFVGGKVCNYWDKPEMDIVKNIGLKNVDAGTFYVDGLNAVEGTTVTIKGLFASSTQADWVLVGKFFLKELTFTFDGTNWIFSRTSYDYTNISLIETDNNPSNYNSEKDAWELYIETDTDICVNWDYKYKGFTYEYNGNTYTTGQVSSAGGKYVYCTVPASVVPNENGAIFTIKAGQYAPDSAGVRYGLNVQNDFSIVIVDGHPKHTQIIDTSNVTIDSNNSNANTIYFSLKDNNGNPIVTELENWESFLSPARFNNERLGETEWATTYSGVFVDDQFRNYWTNPAMNINTTIEFKNQGQGDFFVNMINAVSGTTVVIRGHFVSTYAPPNVDWTVVGDYFIKELKFTYDGTAWQVGDGPQYTEHKGTPVFDMSNGVSGFYFKAGETEFPYSTDWKYNVYAADEEESGVFLNGEKTSVFLKKVNQDHWYVCMSDASIVPEKDDVITVAGDFIYETHKITFAETNFVFDGTEYYPDGEAPVVYTGTPVLSDTEKYGSTVGFYFFANDGASYAENWSLTATAKDGEENGVFVNGEKTAITLKKIQQNMWYVCIGDAGVTLNRGDVLTIKGSFFNGESKKETVMFNEASFEFNGVRFSEGEYTPTDINVTGLAYSDIRYDSAFNRWNMYFTINTNVPGNIDDTYYPYMAYEINGVEYKAHWYKSSSAHTNEGEVIYNLYIPMENDKLPEILDQEYVITLKAGTSQGRNSSDGKGREDGINLTEDFTFVVGNTYQATAPAVDYTTGNGGNPNGIYLTSNDGFPTIGWDYSLTKAGENDGVYVNGEKTEVFIKKFEDNKYYVCLSDVGIIAEEGTLVMLKGTFTTANLNSVSFQTAKYIYEDGQWKVYKVVEDVTSTGVVGDATGDGKFNILDFIRAKKYIAGETNEINITDADMNGDGYINNSDMVLVTKLMLGAIRYENGANITGVPTYNNTDEMRLSAYVSPTLEEGFDDYKAAGFTTLLGENRAVYGADGFEEYMELAEQKGLDVIVHSGHLDAMLLGNEEYNESFIKTMYENVSKYSSFHGIFMADEPKISNFTTYEKVTRVLKTLDPDIVLFTSFLPTYTDESFLWNDNSLSLSEKYVNYANSYGKLFGDFTYDFYPFRHKIKKFFLITTENKDYMRQDWFQNLSLVAANAKGAYNTGITVQSYSERLNSNDYYRDVTQADISFQVYSALAYGMKSINYFTYGTHWDSGVGTTSCMVYNGQKTAVYDAVKNVNTEIKKFDNVLLNFNWQGTIGITGTNSNGIMSFVESYTSKRISDCSASDDAIIGCLKDSNGYDGFMLVNATDPSANVTETISVTFNNADHAKVFVNGEESIVELNNGTYNATLAAGQGIFVIPYIA